MVMNGRLTKTRQLRLFEDYLLIDVVSAMLSKGTKFVSVEIQSS
jgi:hypothetical protein